MICPVALYPATTEAEAVHFNLIKPKTNNRITIQTVDVGTGEEASRGDPMKGFQIAKDQYALGRQGEARRGEARIDAHHRHREVRAGNTSIT